MKHVVVGTAGHIDHGKSTLVLALTGTDPDRLAEEKARGITIDLGFAHTAEGDVVLSFVDVPGHERFVRNMLAGVGGIDVVMLHVAADESVMPQTREHFEICRLLRVRTGLIVITKADLVDADTLDVVRLEIEELVAGSFLDGAPVVPVSARTGAGLPELRATLARLARTSGERLRAGPPRLPIDRVFSMRGFGTVVTGTLVAGTLTEGDELVLLPSARAVKVRGLQVHGRACAAATAGQRVAANLTGVEVHDVSRGETLTRADAVTVTRRADVEIELLASARPLRHGARVRCHQGTRDLAARLALASGWQIAPGTTAAGRLHFDAPATLVRGDRFILRSASPAETVGGGTILDPQPPRRGVRTAAALMRYERLRAENDSALAAMVEDAGLAGFPLSDLGARAGVPPEEHEQRVEALATAGRAVRIETVLVSTAALAAVEEGTIAALTQHHARFPLQEGMPREELRERLFAAAAPPVFEHILSRLARADRIVARDRVALRGHTLALTEEEAQARDGLVQAMQQAGLAPPDHGELAARLHAKPEVVDRIANLLVRQKVLVRVGDLVFHESALRQLKDDVRGLKSARVTETLDVATFKERYHVSRKYAIPLLEFLDRERVTRRVGAARVIL